MRYNTVIFDFDGTLLNTLTDLANAVNYAIGKHGYPTHPEKKIERMIGNGVNMLVARALPRGFDTPDYEAVMDDFRAHYSAHCSDNTAPYGGIYELLHTLRERGVKMAIATNKFQLAAEELRKQFFDGEIGLIVGDYPGRARKPAPDSLLIAMETLGAKPEETVYVGDTEVDMQTAAAAGVDCICVSWGYRTHEELITLGASAIADTPPQLADIL